MKIILPIFGASACNCDVLSWIQLRENNHPLVVRHNNCAEAQHSLKHANIYLNFGLLEFDTDDLFKDKSEAYDGVVDCIKRDKVKFMPMSGWEMGEWFKKQTDCFAPHHSTFPRRQEEDMYCLKE